MKVKFLVRVEKVTKTDKIRNANINIKNEELNWFGHMGRMDGSKQNMNINERNACFSLQLTVPLQKRTRLHLFR